MLAFAACGGDEATSAPAGSPAAAGTGAAEQAGLARAAMAVRTYRATFTVELPTGAVERGTFEMVLPSSVHFTLTASGGATTGETIVIGSDRYTKMGPAWVKLPPGPFPRVLTTTGGLNQLEDFRLAAQNGALAKGGADSLNGRPCQIYSHVVEANTFEYCVSDSLPSRMKVSSTTAIITFLFTAYDQPLEIKAPD